MKNNKGWIEIVEAFFSVLLVAAVVLIIINKGYLNNSDVSEKVYTTELSILREIETNDNFRTEIANIADSSLPVGWNGLPADIQKTVTERTPNYLICTAKICIIEGECVLSEDEKPEDKKNIYSQGVVISPTVGGGEVYRQINLFCWEK
ncbi:Uncharacterised protein [uncultured archaeon]|nr:Uncharacterised protein [uncultured archaeon]